MASILKVDDLRGNTSAGNITITSEGGAATMQLQQGVAKAWANVDGTGTVALRDSFNVSTLTDSGTGVYKLTFTSSMGNADYSSVASGNISTTNSGRDVSCPRSTITTTEIDMACFRSDTLAAEDFDYAMNQVNGDLA